MFNESTIAKAGSDILESLKCVFVVIFCPVAVAVKVVLPVHKVLPVN